MKNISYILIGIFLGISLSLSAHNITWWQPSNYQETQQNDKTSEVQIWCELRTKRAGWKDYCKWNEKYWELTCKGMERFFGIVIEPTSYGDYGCEDTQTLTK